MVTVGEIAVAERFLTALEARDYEGIAACFAPGARLRALVPTALREDEGSGAVAERFRFWLSDLSDFQLLQTDADKFQDRIHLRYRMHGIDPEDGVVTCEQQAYLTLDGDAIAEMNLVCSGWRPAS